jgi:hypothetical protein
MVTCEWLVWCKAEGTHRVEISSATGTQRITVCPVHLENAERYGYRLVDDAGVGGAPVGR